MKTRVLLGAVLGLALVLAPLPAHATGTVTKTLVSHWDLDGAAASTTVIVAAADIADSTTYVIAKQPDTPRPLVLTITDADSSCTAGTVTITGKDSAGNVVTAVGTFAGGGSGSLTLVYSTGFSGNFKSVTSVVTSAITGESVVPGTDQLSVGTTATIPTVYFDERSFGPEGWNLDMVPVTTNGSASTTVAAVTALTAPFARIAVGDILLFNLSGVMTERAVTAKASNDSLTVDQAVTIPTAGVAFYYRKLFLGPDAEDGWLPMHQFRKAMFTFAITKMTPAAGNILSHVDCRVNAPGAPVIAVDSDTFAAAGTVVSTVDLEAMPFDQCRAGYSWSVSDDADGATAQEEDVSIHFAGETR